LYLHKFIYINIYYLTFFISQYLENGANEMESSIATSHEISGRIAQELLNYVDGNDQSLVGSRTRFHSGSTCNREHISYALHPRCGCAWV
jgi:hypothetical protein